MNSKKVNDIRFNQDHDCFIVSMETGLKIYNLDPLLEKRSYDLEAVGSVGKAEMLFRTNMFAVVSGGSKVKVPDNVVVIYDDLTKRPYFEIMFHSTVKSVRLRKDKLIVILQNKIYVYSFLHPTKELFSCETGKNPKGLCEVSVLQNSTKQVMVFPGHKKGSVQILDLSSVVQNTSTAPVYIDAHKGELACLALSRQGTRLATASEQGTLIRVWDTNTRLPIIELRRGIDPASIYCLNFSRNADFLCCSSDKGTVHIFAVKSSNLNKRISVIPASIRGGLGKYGDSQWGLANFNVLTACPCVCAFGNDNTVYALCLDGTFHKYAFSEEGMCLCEGFDVYLEVDNDEETF